MNQSTKETNQLNREKWDKMSDWYSNIGELCSFQGTATLLSMTRASQCNTILEVACATGTHSEIIAMSYLKRGGVLVSCDFSKDMVTGASKKRFNDFKQLEGCSV